ncbi:MAG TPA: hypothetical protein VHG93_02665 [Longimicrobium sp.]|nr:hypothetical protein [Longimicrobium sp.]
MAACFRRRVGHAYGFETLLAEQGSAMDAALWAAYRALEERAALTGRMSARMQERGQTSAGPALPRADGRDAAAGRTHPPVKG